MNFTLINKCAINEQEGIVGEKSAPLGLVVPDLKRKLQVPKDCYVITAQILAIAFEQGKLSKKLTILTSKPPQPGVAAGKRCC